LRSKRVGNIEGENCVGNGVDQDYSEVDEDVEVVWQRKWREALLDPSPNYFDALQYSMLEVLDWAYEVLEKPKFFQLLRLLLGMVV